MRVIAMRRVPSPLWAVVLLLAALACGSGDDADTFVDAASDELLDEDALFEDSGDEPSEPGEPRIVSVSLEPSYARSGERIRAVVRVEDAGSQGYRLSYDWQIADHRLDDAAATVTLPSLGRDDTVRVEVTLETDEGFGIPMVAEAESYNEPPRIYDLKLNTDDVDFLVAEVWGQDAEGDPIEYRYTWVVNEEEVSDVEDARYPTSRLSRGDRVRVQVVASDGSKESSVAETGTLEIANASPEIVSRPPQLSYDGRFTYRVEATDPDGDRGLRFELVRAPRGMEINGLSGEITWRPEADQAGDNIVEVAVHDSRGGTGSQEFNIPIVVRSGDAPQPPAAR